MSHGSGIQGHLLEVTVVGCSKLKDTEWISRQDPYVCLEYASTKFRTRTCTDGGKNPVFQEKTIIPLIEGLREICVNVWNSNTLTFDDFIGSGKIQLQKVLSGGFDDSSWPIQSKSGRFAGEVKLIMHYPNAQKSQVGHSSAYMPQPAPYGGPPYAHHPPSMPSAPYPAASPYPASYPPAAPPMYPATTYPHQPAMQQPYPPMSYPPSAYPPQPYPYPPQAQPSYHPPPPGPYPGIYPPPPY